MGNRLNGRNTKRISVSVHVTEDMRDWLMLISAKEDRSIAYLIRQAVKYWAKHTHGKELS